MNTATLRMSFDSVGGFGSGSGTVSASSATAESRSGKARKEAPPQPPPPRGEGAFRNSPFPLREGGWGVKVLRKDPSPTPPPRGEGLFLAPPSFVGKGAGGVRFFNDLSTLTAFQFDPLEDILHPFKDICIWESQNSYAKFLEDRITPRIVVA